MSNFASTQEQWDDEWKRYCDDATRYFDAEAAKRRVSVVIPLKKGPRVNSDPTIGFDLEAWLKSRE